MMVHRGGPLWSLLLLLLPVFTSSTRSRAAVTNFSPPDSLLQHLTVNGDTGNLYIGATNHIYKLDSDLNILDDIKTGPVEDNQLCRVDQHSGSTCEVDGPPGVNKRPTDNHNKILAIDLTIGKIVTCGSIFQGTCHIRSLHDLSDSQFYNGSENFYVAANNEATSTAAFVGPGPEDYNMLYVATGIVSELDKEDDGDIASLYRIRSRVPAVSSRRLSLTESTLRVLDNGFGGGTSTLFMERGEASALNIKYKAGFYSNGYAYFLTNQLQGGNMISKIIQVCVNDRDFKSLVEIEIICRDDSGENYTLVEAVEVMTPGADLADNLGITVDSSLLVSTFTRPDSTSSAVRHSAVCLYTIDDIRRKINENVLACHRAAITLPQVYAGSSDCKNDSYDVPDNYCGVTDFRDRGPVIGRFPLMGVAWGVYPNENLTAVATSLTNQHTLTYLGTAGGLVKKVVLVDGGMRAVEDITVEEGSSLLPDTALVSNQTHLYVMSQNTVSKVPLWDCGRFTDCGSCLAHPDPHCGWCALENSCTSDGSCQSSQAPLRWLSERPGVCTAITEFSPSSVSLTFPQQISLRVQQLPPLIGGASYWCVFNDSRGSRVLGSVSSSDLSCATDSVMPDIPPAADVTSVRLSLQSSETGVNFLHTDVPFYDCGRHSSCSSCGGAAWGCQWCVHTDSCLDMFSTCSLPGSLSITDPEICPRVLTSDLLLSADYTTEITLMAQYLPLPLDGQSGYKCLVFIRPSPGGDVLVQVDAVRVSANELRCSSSSYNYPGSKGTIDATISIVWHDNFKIEAVTAVTLYRCNRMADDCSTCKSLAAQYSCQWCETSCQYSALCPSPDLPCPAPHIQSVNPLTGPLQGGTLLTINGANLGQNYESIASAVTIGSVVCVAVESLYQTSKVIICRTGSVVAEESSPIKIHLNSHSVYYTQNFTYQDPNPSSLTPIYGPMSGGTLMTITGENLLTGAAIQVFMNAFNDSCNVLLRLSSSESLVCRTPSVFTPGPHMVWLMFDGTRRDLASNEDYEYKPDPNITSVVPLKAYSSGGRKVTIEGSYLDTVQKPVSFLQSGATETSKTACQSISSTRLICEYPNVTAAQIRIRRQAGPPQYWLGLVMDGVQAVRNLSKEVEVVADPFYDQFPDGQKEYKGDALILTGTDLSLACTPQEVVVRIGEELCNVTSLVSAQLVCFPPSQQPAAAEGIYPQVRVEVGNLRFMLGTLQYATDSPKNGDKLPLIVTPAVAGGFLITVIIIILIVYKRKSMEAERQYKMIQAQLDTLESNVRNECKLAFAELQTEVSDFTSDINVIGIPFWDYKSYTFKVLFPGHNDHTILHRTPSTYVNQYGGYEEGIHQFNQLLNSKHFLLIFIRTLEAQKNFGIRDKAVVASLLMVILQDKMEYATEILKALLNELVDRSVEKKHPKLMLRRTESVVEKLVTNWLSLCMYSYLKKHAGKTLFMLYKAIKHQAEKGPVDGITSEARYSLSEDRLLREKIEAKSLTILLLSDNDEGREPVTCRVLDCDTITQAKEKALDAIYMNTPHARRPTVHDVDLVWRSGQSGHLPLRDEDVTTKTDHGWKRVNTLAHYHVKDQAKMSLIPVKDKNDYVREVHGMVEVTSGTSLSGISPVIMMEEGTKVWHLVKHDDNQQGNHRGQKVISEIFLTRLLATKGTLQQYVDDLFGTILRADNTLPPAIKYLFDFLDSAARRHNILDSDVVYTWKSNSLPLRFWVNIIKNPEFVFDVSKSHIVDSCLSVIAQTFMDSCSTTEHRLGKDSPSNKLLFAKDIPRYRQWVSRFYKNVQDMPPVSDQEMTRVMTELSMTNITDFNVAVALKELYKYSMQYSFELAEALDEDPSARKMHLAKRFDQVTATIEGAQYY